MAWGQANPHGSGFQNAGAVGPWAGHDTVVLTGGDTAGIHKSTDRGSNFVNRDASIVGVDSHIASIEPHPTQAGRFFALAGNGTAGSLFETVDYGDTWVDRSTGTAAIFGDGALAGNSGTSSLLGPGNGEHPRSVGRLIAVDAANGYIYVATFKNGVYRGTLGGSIGITSWTRIGLAPGAGTTAYYCRGCTYDPANDVVYVSTFSDPGSSYDTQSGRIWRITTPHGAPTVTEFTASPMCAGAMLVIGDRLYAVAHPITANLTWEGLWYLDTAHNATAGHAWTKIAALPTAGSERWMSLDGYKAGGTTTLWCGSAGMGTHSLCKVTDASGSWQGTIYPTSTTTTINDMGGPNTPVDPWWMYAARNGMMLGRSVFVASTIRINPQNTQEIYVFGRSGAWRTRDGGAHWYPIVKGVGATVCLTVIADPRTQGRVYVGLGDWSLLVSDDNLGTVTNTPPPSGSFAYSTCIDESTNPTTIFQAASPRQDSATFTSKIYRNPDDLGGGAWVDTGFSVANAIVTGLACIYNGTTRVLLAATSAGELWRKNGDAAAWQRIAAASMAPSGGLTFSSTDTTPFARKLGRGEIYLYDRSNGVWRSKDYGATWVRIWNHASSNSDQAGWVAVHPTDKTKLYASDNASVYLITNADTAAQDAATVTTIASAIGAKGPMAVDPVNLKIGICDVTSTPRFWESPLSPISWVDKSDQLYQNAVASPQWLTYDTQGQAIVALSGNGVLASVGSNTPPSAAITTPTASQSFPSGTTSVTLAGTVTDDASGTTAAYSLDGAAPVALTITSGAFSRSVPVTAGTHTIVVTATDAQGLTDTATVAFSVAAVVPPADTTPPSLTVSNPATNATVPNATATQTVAGTATDNVAVNTLTVNGTQISIFAGNYSTSIPLAVGSNTITVVATDTSGNRTTVVRTITRAAADVPPFFTTKASITGSPIAGNTLHGVDGSVTGSPPPTLGGRVWRKSDGTQVGTGNTFLVPSTTLDGETLTYEVVATNSAGSATSTSDPTAAVSTPVNPPVWTADPTITGQTGNGRSGDTLTGHDGTFSPGSVSSRKWQSSPNGLPGTEVDIGGATTTSLSPDDTYIGKYVRYYVDAVNGGVHNTDTSAWLGPIVAAPVNNVAPANTVLPQLAVAVTTLSVTPGEWTGIPAPDITHQLSYSDDGVSWTAVDGATALSYTIPTLLLGKRWKVTERATNVVTTKTVDSAPTGVVDAPGFDVTVISEDQGEIVLRVKQRSL